jgi:hypothetical protein
MGLKKNNCLLSGQYKNLNSSKSLPFFPYNYALSKFLKTQPPPRKENGWSLTRKTIYYNKPSSILIRCASLDYHQNKTTITC